MLGCAPARDIQAGYISWGHSIVTDPWGQVMKQLDEKEGILIEENRFGPGRPDQRAASIIKTPQI